MNIDPVALRLFGLEIRWYGIVYFVGFLTTYILFIKSKIELSKEEKEDLFLYLAISSILFGRLFHILFYEPIYYISNPLQIITFWNGGMSIHGGIFGGFLAMYYYSKRKNISFFKLSDFFVVPLSFFLGIGRIANFINQELYGYIIINPYLKFLGVRFERVDNYLRYPVQIFEAVKNFALYTFLKVTSFREGEKTAWFLIIYNWGRFIIDFLRVPEGVGKLVYNYIGISLGQLFCIIYGTIGIILLIKIKKRRLSLKNYK